MKLNAKVIETISGDSYGDNQPRVKLKVAEADSCFRTFIVPNDGGLGLDDEVVMLVLTKEQAAAISASLSDAETEHVLPDAVALIRDQLRPDAPPPWEQAEQPLRQAMADTAHLDDVTQEFVREVQQ